jgi:hypothetical protein
VPTETKTRDSFHTLRLNMFFGRVGRLAVSPAKRCYRPVCQAIRARRWADEGFFGGVNMPRRDMCNMGRLSGGQGKV